MVTPASTSFQRLPDQAYPRFSVCVMVSGDRSGELYCCTFRVLNVLHYFHEKTLMVKVLPDCYRKRTLNAYGVEEVMYERFDSW